jgi:hypothetical protein
MAIKTIRVFAEYTSDGYVPMPSQGNIDYGITIGNSFPETQPSSYQTDDPNIDVAVNTMTDFYVWIRTHGSPWNPSYTRVVRVYPDSPSINSVVMNMIVAVGSGGTSINAGGGVTYYLNGGTSQGVLDGSTYYEMSKTPVQGAMVDFFKINTTGFENIAQFVTDAGDPSLLKIPPGAWPLGFYFSASDNSGSPKFYAEIYKYSNTGVFTLLGSSVASAEVISNGVAIDYYTTTVTIPDTTLLITDRIAIRIFVDTDGNRTVNFHTQDSHLASVGTTFANGLTAINGLTKQVQFIAIGNAGSDAAIVSSDDTHTINLPTASATKRGLLNSTDWATFNAKQAALSGTGFVKIDGSTISYDNSSYQPLDGDLTAIGALAGTTGILKKTGANTWELDTTTYLSTGVAASTYQRLDKMVSNLLASDTEYPNSNAVLAALALKANALNPEFTGSMTVGGAYPKIYLTDSDNNPDYFIGNDDGYFRIYDQTNTASRFYITNLGVSTFPGSVVVGSIAKSGGLSTEFLKADGTVDANTYVTSGSLSNYLLSATAASTYQRLDKMVSNLLASDTEYPNSNAVLAALALKADAASPTFTGNMTISSASPKLYLTDTDNNPDYFIGNDDGYFRIYDQTNTVSRFYITNLGVSTFPGDVIVGSIAKSGGTASQFLKADGSVDSNTYLTSYTETDTLASVTARGATTSTPITVTASEGREVKVYMASTYTTDDLVSGHEYGWYDDHWRLGMTRSGASAGADFVIQWNGARRLSLTNTGNLTVTGTISASNLSGTNTGDQTLTSLGAQAKLDGTGFVKASGTTITYDNSTYLNTTDAATIYQRKDKMVSNLLASDTEYPNSNAVLAKLALKADAANPVFTGDMTISGIAPKLYFTDTDNNPDYTLFVDSGYFYIYDQTAGVTKFQITPSGNAINTGTLTSASFIKSGGTSSQYLMADGSVSTLSGLVTGSGGTNYLPKWTSASALGNSLIYDHGDAISIATTSNVNAVRLQVAATSGSWISGTFAGTGNADKVVIGNYLGPTIGGHNSALNSWASLAINPEGGNVMIGTPTNSGYKFDVNGTSRFSGALTIKTSSVGGTYFGQLIVEENGEAAIQIKGLNYSSIYFSDATTMNEAGIVYNHSTNNLELRGSGNTADLTIAANGGGLFSSTLQTNGNVGIRVTPSSAGDQYLTTGDAGIAYSNTYFGTGQVRIGGGADHVGNTVLSVAPGVVNFDRPGVGGGALKIFSDGKIGINQTTNNGYQLDVSGTGRFSGQLTSDYRLGLPGMTIGYWDSVNNRIESGSRPLLITSYSQPIYIGQSGSANLTIATSGAATFSSSVTTQGELNVGFGTLSSDRMMQVSGTAFTSGTSQFGAVFNPTFGNTITNLYGIYISLSSGTSVTNRYALFVDGPNSGTATNDYSIYSGNAAKSYFAGNVGIGTNSPGEKFEVNGSIKAIGRTINATSTGGLSLGYESGIGYLETWNSSALIVRTYNYQSFNVSGTQYLKINTNGNILINTNTDAGYNVYVNGQIAMDTGSFKAILGGVQASWAGSASYPTLYGSSNDRWVMHINPHVSYTQNGVNGYTGTTYGAMLRMAGNAAADMYWDIGIGVCSVGTDKFAIGRNSTALLTMTNGGAVTAASFFESSDKTIKTLIEDNYQTKGIESIIAKLYIKNGKEELGYFAQDVQEILPSAVSKGTDGLLSLSYREVHTAKIARLEKRVSELEQLLNLN